MTASDPRHVIEEVEENCEADTGKALVTGTDDTTSFNASLDLNPRLIHRLTGGLGGSVNSLESSKADTSSSGMEVKEVVEVKEAAAVNTPSPERGGLTCSGAGWTSGMTVPATARCASAGSLNVTGQITEDLDGMST